jgi:hypothetical protein
MDLEGAGVGGWGANMGVWGTFPHTPRPDPLSAIENILLCDAQYVVVRSSRI